MLSKISINTRCSMLFGLFYRLFYPALIMFSSYMVLRGFESRLVAKMLTLMGIAVIISKPVYAVFIDKGHCKIIVYILILLQFTGTAFFFFAKTRTIIHAVVFVICVVRTVSGVMEIIDSWALKLSVEYPEIVYSKIRSRGSMSFAFMGLGYGIILSKCGLMIAPVIIFILLILFFIVARSLPDPKADFGQTKKEKSSFWDGIKVLTGNRKLLSFIVFYAIGASVIDLTDNYIGVAILEKGGTTAYTGVHDFLKAMIEFAVMYSAAKLLKKYSTKTILCVGMAGLFIKGVSAALMPTPFLVVCTCVTQMISFPLVIAAKMEYIKENTPPENLALVVSATGIGVSLFCTFVMNPLMAVMIPKIGASYAMGIMSVCGLIRAAGILTGKKA